MISSLSRIINDEIAINFFFVSYLERIDCNKASTTSKSIDTVVTCILRKDKPSIKF